MTADLLSKRRLARVARWWLAAGAQVVAADFHASVDIRPGAARLLGNAGIFEYPTTAVAAIPGLHGETVSQ